MSDPSMIPSGVGAVGSQVADYISQSKGNSGGNSSVAAASADASRSVSDKMIIDVLQHTIPGGNDVSGMIQPRPQQMPSNAIAPKQIPMGQPVGNVNATTHGGQRRNDINNLISGVSNIVKGAVNTKREKEARDLTSDLQIIEAASSNPNDPHNQAIMQSIANDPKRVKRLEKALGYNPMSGEPPTPEAQILAKYSADSAQKKTQKTQAITQAIASKLGPQAAQQGQGGQQGQPGQGGSAMNNYMNRQPITNQLTPTVQLQAELIKAGIIPKADTSLNAMKDLVKEMITNDQKYAELKAKAEASNNATLMKFKVAVEEGRARYETEALRQSGENARQDVKSKDYQARTNMMKDKLEKQYGAQKAANLIATLGSFDKDIASTQKEIDQTQARGDKKAADGLFNKLHDIQNRKATMESVLGLKDPDIKSSGIGSGVNLLDLPASSKDMDEEDEMQFQ